MNFRTHLPCLLALASLASACDPQADDTYKGEPLASLSGTVQVADGQAVSDEIFTAVVWHDFADSDSAALSERVAVEGSFPAAFSLELYEPPPSSVFYDVEDPETDVPTGKNIAVGYVCVLSPETPDGDMQVIRDQALGLENDHLLVYAEESVDEELLRGVFPGGLVPGYQLFRVVRENTNAEAEACHAPLDACLDACMAAHCTPDGAECDEAVGPCLDTCFEEHDISGCPEFVDNRDRLEPTTMSDELSIVLGGPKPEPDWF